MISLPDLTQKIIETDNIPETEWEALKKSFENCIGNCHDKDQIAESIKMVNASVFPVTLKNQLYEKLISLGGASKEILLAYSDHLWLHGPDWDEYAEELKNKAEQMKE